MARAQSASFYHRPLSRPSIAWITAATGLALIPHVLHLPMWISALAAGSLAVRYAAAVTRRAAPMRGLLTLAAVAGTFGVFVQYGTLIGRDAGVALLILMLALKLLEARYLRDGILVVFLGYFVVAAGFFYSQEVPLTLYMGAVVVVITAALIQLNQQGGGSLRARLRLASILLAQSVPLMLVMFLWFPRLSGPLWALPEEPVRALTGLGDEMTLGAINRLVRSDEVAFRVTFADESPAAADRYWRGPVFWNFDGRTWRPMAAEQREFAAARIDTEGWERSIRYTVRLEPHNEHWLFALDMPANVPERALLDPDYQLLSKEPVRERRRYHVTSYTDYTIDAELSAGERALALELPEGIAPRTRRLAAAWRREHRNDIGLVQAALRYLREQPFAYTLSPPLLGAHPVDEFLFETRAGFCEHYAGSFAVLMRAAGIPARVVTGYLGGEWNVLGGYMLVRQSDAHAWTEVWLAGRGWVRVDPTAAVSPTRIEQGLSGVLASERLPLFWRGSYGDSLMNHLSLLWDHANFKWNEWVLAFGPDKQRALLQSLGIDHQNWRTLAAGMMLSIGLIITLYAFVFAWNNKPSHPPAVRLYRRFCVKLAKSGVARESFEGPLDYAARVASARPDLAEAVLKIARLYGTMRYGRDSEQRENLRRMRQLTRALRI